MVASRCRAGLLGAGAALALAHVGSASAATTVQRDASRRPAFSFTAPAGSGSFGSAIGNASRAAGVSGGSFRFTPSATSASRRKVTVAVRARASNRSDAQRTAMLRDAGLTPSTYNLGLAVGWKRFQLSGDVARIDGGMLPTSREAMDIGLSYLAPRWSARLAVGADRASGDHSVQIASEQSYSADLGGSYSLTRNLDVTGGVRYKLQQDRLEPLADTRRDSQSVYIGTAFRF